MMARPKSPDGKSTLLAFKISERQQAAYDAARGGVPMAEWARSALDRAAALEGRWPEIVVDGRMPPGTAALAGPGCGGEPQMVIMTGLSAEPPPRSSPRKRTAAVPQAAFSDPPENPLPAPGPEPRRCDHPGRRVNGGWCVQCQWTILPGGKFAERQR